jgi:hypothetical protein
MPAIEITATEGDKISVHAPSRVIDQLAGAFDRMDKPVPYDVFRAEDGADLLTTRTALDAVLAKNPAIKAQFDRDTGMDDVRPDAVVTRR